MIKTTAHTEVQFPACIIAGKSTWNIPWEALGTHQGLYDLDAAFQDYLSIKSPHVYKALHAYREGQYTRAEQSHFIMEMAPILEAFWLEAFRMGEHYQPLLHTIEDEEPVLAFRKWVVRALKEPPEVDDALWQAMNASWHKKFQDSTDHELLVAVTWQEASSEEREQLLMWLVRVISLRLWGSEYWDSLKGPEKIDWDALFPVRVDDDGIKTHVRRIERPENFDLTDHGYSLRKTQMEADYCLYCHRNGGDYCSIGFLHKKGDHHQGVKNNPMGDALWGCPIEQHISEMNLLRRRGAVFAALATIMVENPLCSLTGHRICNDCSMACIYQKQKPVDIPYVESRTLKDILSMPWGAEWYMLLMVWNPLRCKQYLPKMPGDKHVLIMGLGPSGIASMYHLWMEGVHVVGYDGLTIEQPPEAWVHQPLQDISQWWQPLSERSQKGFGGVAEYGITVRWDKNLLTLPWLLCARRGMQFCGGVRLGGTLTIDDVWAMGFKHMVLALGAGLPHALNIPGSLAKGMRSANDFLMNLQLQGANHPQALTLMDVRLPAVVIGGGLTSVDAATELQAYYIHLIRRVSEVVRAIQKVMPDFWSLWHASERVVIEEWLEHASWLEHGMSVQTLLQRLGGVTIVYRRDMVDSPSYRGNAHELDHAMMQGIKFLDYHTPEKIYVDADGRVGSIQLKHVEHHVAYNIASRTILLAIGSQPNVAYEYEHAGTFLKSHGYYTAHSGTESLESESSLLPAKLSRAAMMTSYNKHNHRISYVGDLHPQYHGSVVKALASAKKAYGQIMEALDMLAPSDIASGVCAMPVVHSVEYVSDHMVRLVVHAPMHARRAMPGHFFRVHPYSTPRVEACPLTLFSCDNDNLIFMVRCVGVSSQYLATLKVGEPVALMGPTGVRMRMDDPSETTLILSDSTGLPMAWALALQMAQKNIAVYVACMCAPEDLPWIETLFSAVTGVYILPQNDTWPDALSYAPFPYEDIKRVVLQGKASFLKRASVLRKIEGLCLQDRRFIASAYGPMQCMLKGVCAQCWQWQIDPHTQERTKPVFACSWQDQPLELMDLEHLEDRQTGNIITDRLMALYSKVV